ncbi:hypothetical protein JTB14_037368 [Gonioctena quinquepunctata]|nr:hypothetical protein JTB14_037368 [Gonioctena quinquepunctata]
MLGLWNFSTAVAVSSSIEISMAKRSDPRSGVAALIEQLVLIRYSECSGMDEYLNKKMKIAQQLKAIDTEIKSGVLAALIFVSIPDDFKPLIMAIENCGLELTTDLVKERVLVEAAKYENDGKKSALISN